MALPVSKPTRADILLITFVLMFSIVTIFFNIILSTDIASGFEIIVDGKLHSSYTFSELKNGETIEINTQYGHNKFLYENKSIKCIQTDCKDMIELKTGTIKKTNETLVCIPHRLIVQITGETDIDAISY